MQEEGLDLGRKQRLVTVIGREEHLMDAELAGLLGLGVCRLVELPSQSQCLGPRLNRPLVARGRGRNLRCFLTAMASGRTFLPMVARGSMDNRLARLFMSLYGMLYEIIGINQSHS